MRVNSLLVRYNGGYREVSSFGLLTPGGDQLLSTNGEPLLSTSQGAGRIEGFVNYPEATEGEAVRWASSTIDTLEAARWNRTVGIEPTGTGDVPFSDFDIGDTITTPDQDGNAAAVRVIGMTLTEDEAGHAVYVPEVGDDIPSLDQRRSDINRSMNAGTLGGRDLKAMPRAAGRSGSAVKVTEPAVGDGDVTVVVGSAEIEHPDTTTAVPHGLGSPTSRSFQVTPTNDMGSAAKFWIDAVDDTNLTIGIDQSPGSGNTARFVWLARDTSIADSGNGGSASEPGDGYRYHTFTSSGNFTVQGGGSLDVEYLVAGGGGGGGSDYAGGGGGGEVLTGSISISGSASVTVGAGGAVNSSGGSSTLGAITADGGGGGGNGGKVSQALMAGGSGGNGGGGGGSTGVSAGLGGSGDQYAGGDGYNTTGSGSATDRAGGGGGGAGAAGQNAGAGAGGNGGAGIEWPTGSGTYYGGGGGGGTRSVNNPGTGGAGGGGDGAYNSSPAAGTSNTGGGGGGGGGVSPANTGAIGGSGVVIIRYPI